MSQPTTNWENNGSWTSMADEETFLKQIESETDLRLSVVGQSVQGRNIWNAEIGNPNGKAILILGSQHGHERSGRESCLLWARDLAYSEEPEIQSFLSENRFVIVTNANPDGVVASTRHNANDVDMNRDWYIPTQPETKAIKALILETEPVISVDLHEWGGFPEFTFGYFGYGTGGFLPGHHEMMPLSYDYLDYSIAEIEAAGYVTRQFPSGDGLARGTFLEAAISWHSMAYLVETASSFSKRVTSARLFLEVTRAWYSNRKTQLNAAIQSSINDSINGISPLWVPYRDRFDNHGAWIQIEDPGFYTIPEHIEIPTEQLELAGLEIDGRQVSTRQKYRGLVPAFFDYRSRMSLLPYKDPNDYNLTESGIVKHDGLRYPVQNLVAKQSGTRYPVHNLVSKVNGIRHIA